LLLVGFGAVPAQWILSTPFLGNVYQLDNTGLTAALTPLLVVCGV